MKLSEKNLQLAITKFDEVCFDIIIKKEINARLKRVKYILLDATFVYIQYNNHGEYSYSIIYSPMDQDLCRFDNYDQHWDVISRPHHFHPQKIYDAQESPMKGDPQNDMQELCRFLRINL